MSPALTEERRAGPLTIGASVGGWLLSYLGVFPALAFRREPCATGGGSEMQMLGAVNAFVLWLGAFGLLALGKRGLGRTGWLGLGHTVAFVLSVVQLAPALLHTVLGGLAICWAYEESAVREQWAFSAALHERVCRDGNPGDCGRLRPRGNPLGWARVAGRGPRLDSRDPWCLEAPWRLSRPLAAPPEFQVTGNCFFILK